MIRGEIWTAAGGHDYAGKPRPAVIVQSDGAETRASITVCLFTTDATEAPLVRVPIQPSPANGLKEISRIMVDKISTIPRAKLGERVGRLNDLDMARLNRAIIVFLGLAD